MQKFLKTKSFCSDDEMQGYNSGAEMRALIVKKDKFVMIRAKAAALAFFVTLGNSVSWGKLQRLLMVEHILSMNYWKKESIKFFAWATFIQTILGIILI